MKEPKIVAHGDASLLITWEQTIDPEINRKVTLLVHLIKDQKIEGVIDFIPAFCSLVINYDPRVIKFKIIKEKIKTLLNIDVKTENTRKRVFEIPVCYGGEYGPDIDFIAKNARLSVDEVIKRHCSTDYLIYMLGFLPGFSYLGGLDESIHTPRLDNPRKAIPAGSVGIGGSQTGIYPLESPGGWQLLGRTPIKTYDPNREVPILFEAGDYIRFVPITAKRYDEIAQLITYDQYQCQIIEMEG